jgi:DNA topoisomerase-2
MTESMTTTTPTPLPTPAPLPSAAAPSIESQYQKLTDREHVLLKPGMYIGDIEYTDQTTYVRDPTTDTIVSREVKMNPGLLKIFDEVLINARDQVVRLTSRPTPSPHPVTCISVDITDDGLITVTNDGEGVDVVKHTEHDMWVPEMIFGHLRSSANYGSDKRIVGGLNGYGSKLAFIWSTDSSVETVDHTRGLKFKQSFGKNLESRGKPSVTKTKVKPYTTITFRPDYARFGVDMVGGLPAGIKSVFERRVYDIAAVTEKQVRVKYNGTALPVKTFEQYIDQYIGAKADAPRTYESGDERWEYAVALSPTEEFEQVSFVNGIYTSKGGKHVDYVVGQITRKLIAYIETKKKVKVKASTIKEQLMVFVRCDIVNPAFDSQTKDYLGTPSTKFGSSCTVSDKFIDKIAKMGVMEASLSLTQAKDNSKAAKDTDGVKKRTITGIPKLIDANLAGTDRSAECTLILCEGDSAKAGVVSGLSREDRARFGVYPLKGKLFNVRGEMAKRIGENKEITEMKKILGLENGKRYTADNVGGCLRYGKVLFMTDQDLDGSHIKGLGLNLFENQWNTLVRIPGFIGYMNTPILKAKKGSEVKQFYTDAEYELWRESVGAAVADTWKVKYFKGLGTSSAAEFKEYFKDQKIVTFSHSGDASSDAIDMVFNKMRADDRKGWLESYDRELAMDLTKTSVSFEEFIGREMIHFSVYDNSRSLPNVMDGLKISLRKVIFAAFKKKLTTEIKVAQFTGYVSEHSGYHHGEASLNGAIVAMAQNFVGSNNINLFQGNGQFGTRLQGGSDSASERYIFTLLNTATRHIFPEADDEILTFLKDDGTPVEPIHYAPIIPMLLVNGSKGIGTGFSTEILSHDPRQIIQHLKTRLSGGATPGTIKPHYQGFTGRIDDISAPDAPAKYLIRGKYEVVATDTVHVTELPVGYWTEDFKQYLESLQDTNGKKLFGGKPAIREYADMSTDTVVDFTVKFQKGLLMKLQKETKDMSENPEVIHSVDGIEKLLKLTTTKYTTNMHAFDHKECLKRYSSIYDIVDDHYKVRLDLYGVRRQAMIVRLERELAIITNKVWYIEGTLDDTIDLRRKSKEEIRALLSSFDTFGDEDRKYLTQMPMSSVSKESVERLNAEKEKKQTEHDDVVNTQPPQMWLRELVALEAVLGDGVSSVASGVSGATKTHKKKIVVRKKKAIAV